MRITVNGAEREIPPDTTVAALVSLLEVTADRVAVEHNGWVVPRRTWSDVVLAGGDKIEIVTFVGGG